MAPLTSRHTVEVARFGLSNICVSVVSGQPSSPDCCSCRSAVAATSLATSPLCDRMFSPFAVPWGGGRSRSFAAHCRAGGERFCRPLVCARGHTITTTVVVIGSIHDKSSYCGNPTSHDFTHVYSFIPYSQESKLLYNILFTTLLDCY